MTIDGFTLQLGPRNKDLVHFWAGVTLYLRHFLRKNEKSTQTNDPWFILTINSGREQFGLPNCPVRGLKYYFHYTVEHLELRKSGHLLFIPIKDNNAASELSAVTISRWICNTFHSCLKMAIIGLLSCA